MKRTSQLVGHEPSLNQLSTAGVVASCKIPILATRVRFPGSAFFISSFLCQTIECFFLFFTRIILAVQTKILLIEINLRIRP